MPKRLSAEIERDVHRLAAKGHTLRLAFPPETGHVPTLLLDDPVTARTLRAVGSRENCAIGGYCTT
jgi:hypothetical protein